jgi:hypothetical protein
VANEFGLGTVQRYAMDGSFTTFSGFVQPMDVIVDRAGAIWVLDAGATGSGEGPRLFHYSSVWERLNDFPISAALAVNALLIQPAHGPRLSIALAAGDQVVLSWPTNQVGFLLEQSLDLATANWTTLPVTNYGGAVIASPTNAQSFFRLRSP